jgi:hypothetical protein
MAKYSIVVPFHNEDENVDCPMFCTSEIVSVAQRHSRIQTGRCRRRRARPALENACSVFPLPHRPGG